MPEDAGRPQSRHPARGAPSTDERRDQARRPETYGTEVAYFSPDRYGRPRFRHRTEGARIAIDMMHASAEPTDTALMQEIQQGSELALGLLYRRFERRAYRTAVATCRDRDCAEDAVQDAFVSMWSSRASYRPERGPVLAWAMSIVRHRAIYLARRRTRGLAPDERTAWLEAQPAGDDVPGEVESHAEAAQLEQLMRRLPDAQREVIRLAFFEGMTHEQIAVRLSIPPGTVKGRVRLGLKKLRSGLEPDH